MVSSSFTCPISIFSHSLSFYFDSVVIFPAEVILPLVTAYCKPGSPFNLFLILDVPVEAFLLSFPMPNPLYLGYTFLLSIPCIAFCNNEISCDRPGPWHLWSASPSQHSKTALHQAIHRCSRIELASLSPPPSLFRLGFDLYLSLGCTTTLCACTFWSLTVIRLSLLMVLFPWLK